MVILIEVPEQQPCFLGCPDGMSIRAYGIPRTSHPGLRLAYTSEAEVGANGSFGKGGFCRLQPTLKGSQADMTCY